MSRRYDAKTTTFSPEGRLYQVNTDELDLLLNARTFLYFYLEINPENECSLSQIQICDGKSSFSQTSNILPTCANAVKCAVQSECAFQNSFTESHRFSTLRKSL